MNKLDVSYIKKIDGMGGGGAECIFPLISKPSIKFVVEIINVLGAGTTFIQVYVNTCS